ncbi:cytochrome c biogenesis heme-transporting ATPase CcmA [Aestuariibacter sp. AA17]|uniref:Cytochrome c biogenesis heme-transporting ATPase CcmA n=1 Tax=Fluctibacter corallii TaxID=2984329 RepID=A0ABT3A3X4_9ALTE|nr:cytochrome c biogenesis heme-transporting ATPase CcmA [Aestuariibacter sp. AA17]MCV2883307.1 cytochrome c biogenesis heme-transporting ATPase CcmA [Aestuariibacter sp. AA17]
MSLLSGHHLSCSKRDRLLFDDISLAVEPSDVLYIRGPNGAGKTSLIRILVGLSTPDTGSVTYRDNCIRSHYDVFHHHLVYFGHKLGLNTHFSPLENLRHWCKQHQISVRDDHIVSVLDELGLVGLETLPVSSLSAGQQRRVALARLWLKNHADMWVLDEPFTALDVQGIALLKARLVEHTAKGGGVIMTSHQDLALSIPVRELALEYRI